MNRLALKLGFWASLGVAVTFVLYTLSFVAILMTSPVFTWTNLTDYVTHTQTYSQLFPDLGRLTMLLFGPFFIVMLNSLHEYVPADKKILTRISLCFAIMFVVTTGAAYFVQLTAVKLNIAQGQYQGLEHYVQANPISLISGINMIGWTLFLGLASLFIAPVFSGRGLPAVIKAAFLGNGLCCLLGGIGYAYNLFVVIFLTLTLGMGAAIMVAAVALCLFFRKQLEIGNR